MNSSTGCAWRLSIEIPFICRITTHQIMFVIVAAGSMMHTGTCASFPFAIVVYMIHLPLYGKGSCADLLLRLAEPLTGWRACSFTEGKKFRQPVYLATSFDQHVTAEFIQRATEPSRVRWRIHMDPEHPCLHANLVKRSNVGPHEREYLFPPCESTPRFLDLDTHLFSVERAGSLLFALLFDPALFACRLCLLGDVGATASGHRGRSAHY
jgi:hypothetical protein